MARNVETPAPAAPHPESKIDLQRTSTSDEPHSPTLEVSNVSSLNSPDRSLSLLTTPPVELRNQAPGISDRRKSVRPSSRSQSRQQGREAKKGKAASPLSISMANTGNAMKLRDDDEDETPGEKSVCRNGWSYVPEECCGLTHVL
jgi:hypothetical protein